MAEVWQKVGIEFVVARSLGYRNCSVWNATIPANVSERGTAVARSVFRTLSSLSGFAETISRCARTYTSASATTIPPIPVPTGDSNDVTVAETPAALEDALLAELETTAVAPICISTGTSALLLTVTKVSAYSG